MNFLSANTTNHKRTIMFVAAGALAITFSLVFYKYPITFRDFVIPPVVGLAVFEILFRTRKWLSLASLPMYIIVVLLVTQILYTILYGMSYVSYGGGMDFSGTLPFPFRDFPNSLYALIESALLTGIAYYLIKFYRTDAWIVSESQPAATSNEPVFVDEGPVTFSRWLRKNKKQISGFLGWYVINIALWLLIGARPGEYLEEIFFNLLIFPVNLLVLIILAVIKSTRKIAQGILLALALNFLISFVVGAFLGGLCFVPFIFPIDQLHIY